MRARWTDMQETVGRAIIQVGETAVLEENLHIECMLCPIGHNGRYALDVASDMHWDKRGRRYDSLSGCSVSVGLRADLPLGIEPLSSVCIKCKNETPHDGTVCPKNYHGFSKGMQAHGAAKIVRRLFENEKHKCYVTHLVTDNDSSVRKILTHSYKELIAASGMTEAEWPQDSR
jgi:hypothetical protein